MYKASSRLLNRNAQQLNRLLWIHRHSSSTTGPPPRPRPRPYPRPNPRRINRPALLASSALLLALGLSPWYMTQIHADTTHSDEAEADSDDVGASLGALLRSYAVYTMCSFPTLVDYSPKLLELGSLPGLKWFTEALVRVTFFDQFVGGDTAQKTVPLLHTLRASNKGALFAYSVEVDEAEATSSSSVSSHKHQSPHKRIVDEMVRCIDVAADFEDGLSQDTQKGTGKGRRTWVAVKITALLPDAHALIRLSSHLLSTRPAPPQPIPFPGIPHASDLDVLQSGPVGDLSREDVEAVRELYNDLVRICTRAEQRGVRIIIDAEYSWYQPALDALTLALMRRFNNLDKDRSDTSTVQPLVYGTYQAYLQRTPAHLAHSLADAKTHNYALGVKLVRGAYHPHEIAAHAHAHAGARSDSHGDSHGHGGLDGGHKKEKEKEKEKYSQSISPDSHPPVWETKAETDRCYDACAKVLVNAIEEDLSLSSTPAQTQTQTQTPKVGVLFGTHNWTSCALVLDELVSAGLARREGGVGEGGEGKDKGKGVVVLGDEVTERVTLGQLYGMSDELTDFLVRRTRSSAPLIIKYVPYGALSEVMPYLSRRAIENKSVLGDGGAAVERKRAGAEIRKRLFGWWGVGGGGK